MARRFPIHFIIVVSLLLLGAAGALIAAVMMRSAPTTPASDEPSRPLATPAAVDVRATDVPAASDDERATGPVEVVDFASLEPGAVYDRPYAARSAVDVDPSAPLLVAFSGPLHANWREDTRVMISRAGQPLDPPTLAWRTDDELIIRPARPLAAGEWHTLWIELPHDAAATSPIASFVFRTRSSLAAHTVAADFDGDGRVDLVTGGPHQPLRFFRNGGEVPEPPGEPCGIREGVVALAPVNINASPTPELAVVVDDPGRQQTRLHMLACGGEGWHRVGDPLVLADGAADRPAPMALLAGDLTGNKRDDLLVIDPFGRHRVIHTGRDSQFTVRRLTDVADVPGGVVTAAALADLDSDSMPDLALADFTGTVHGLINDRTGTGFLTCELARDAGVVTSLLVARLDDDRHPELFLGRADGSDDVYVGMPGPMGVHFRKATPPGLVPEDASAWTRAAAVVDLNADRKPDLVAARSRLGGVAINLNDREGGFHLPITVRSNGAVRPAGIHLTGQAEDGVETGGDLADDVVSLLGADFDGDGSKDLFAVTADGRSFFLLTRHHIFRPPPQTHGVVTFEEIEGALPTPSGPAACAVSGDVDRDGRLDLAIGLRDGGAEIWLGTSQGVFVRWQFLPDVRGGHLVLTDADGDGDPDLLDLDVDPEGLRRRDEDDPVILVAWNEGVQADDDGADSAAAILPRGRFGSPTTFVEHSDIDTPTTAAVADFNNDGLADVFLGGSAGSALMLNAGRGTFVDMHLPNEIGASELAPPVTGAIAADFDSDGLTDLVLSTGRRSDGSATPDVWLRNNGDAGFQAIPLPSSDQASLGMSAGDLDADSSPDLVWLDPENLVLEVRLATGSDSGRPGAAYWERRALPLGDLFERVSGVSLLDLDGDGTVEPVVSGRRAESAWQEVWRSDGYGTLVYAESAGLSLRAVTAGYGLEPLLAADLTGNQRPDLLAIDDDGRLHLYGTRTN